MAQTKEAGGDFFAVQIFALVVLFTPQQQLEPVLSIRVSHSEYFHVSLLSATESHFGNQRDARQPQRNPHLHMTILRPLDHNTSISTRPSELCLWTLLPSGNESGSAQRTEIRIYLQAP